MFEKTACDQCGTALMPGAKFCRQCGKAVTGHAPGASVTEATTRTLNPSHPYEAPPQYGDARLSPTPHAHGPLTQTPDTKAPEQANSKPRKLTGAKLVILIVAVVLLFPLVTFALTTAWRILTRTRRMVVMQREMPPAPPPMPDVRGPRAGVPAPPPPPGISAQLLYPGAETTANFIQGDGGSQLHLRTKDGAEKVADWYAARVRPIQTIKSPDGVTILQFTEGQVIIKPEGSATAIFIMRHSG